MAYSFKKKDNIGNQRTEYSRYYSNFRGVDFSSDHTQVHENRLAYLVNMYKDYQSGQGEALETIPGFRRRARFNGDEVYGIHHFKCEENGEQVLRVLVHSGTKLYLWHNYPYSINIVQTHAIVAEELLDGAVVVGDETIKQFVSKIDFVCKEVISVKTIARQSLAFEYNEETNTLTYYSSTTKNGDFLEIEYYEGINDYDALYSAMNERKSSSFICNNKLYIIDGKNFLVYDGKTIADVSADAYVPTTYIGVIPSGENADIGKEYEPRNMLSHKFKTTFKATGDAKDYFLNESDLDNVDEVWVYGRKLDANEYSVDLSAGRVTFVEAPKKPEEMPMKDANGDLIEFEGGVSVDETDKTYLPYGKDYYGVEIVASKKWTTLDSVHFEEDIADIIKGCTLCATFDNRVFLSGNPKYHNLLFWCRLTSGYANPSYFSVIDWMPDGVGAAAITGLMCVSDTLMVLKEDTQQDSAIYYHTGESVDNIATRVYPAQQGLSGLGCVGACRNFLDDPIFISRLGVEGVSQLKIASERSNEHRSSLIDAKLVNTDLSKACLEEWGGYLCVLTDGKIFLADSRQRYQDKIGAMQYEWYYLEDIGVWDNQYVEYKYAEEMPIGFSNATIEHEGKELLLEIASNVYDANLREIKDLRGVTANQDDSVAIHSALAVAKYEGIEYNVLVDYVVHEYKDENNKTQIHAYFCLTKGNYIGGEFKKATVLHTMEDNLFFGCKNGDICSFNFDQRSAGEIPTNAYHFNNRTIYCGCATLMDNCQIPHLTKNTIKKSTVVKTRSFSNSAAKIKVRTNKKQYEQIARISSEAFDFGAVDFSNLSFVTMEQSLFAVKEKEKQWVEKQYFIYSDEYMKPFSLYYVSFRYNVAGRFKN